MKFSAKIKGIGKPLENVRKLEKAIQRRGQRAALNRAAIVIQTPMRQMAPRGETGGLKKSLSAAKARKIKINQSRGTAYAIIGPSRRFFTTYADGKRYQPGNIAHLVEGGRKEVKPKRSGLLSRGRGRGVIGASAAAVAGRPFVKRAFAAKRSAALAEYNRTLGPFTEKEAEKINRTNPIR